MLILKDKMIMSIHGIKHRQVADIQHFSDNIFFSGCTCNCPYCFNPELQDFLDGQKVEAGRLGKEFYFPSKWISLLGGDPMCQDFNGLRTVVHHLKNKGKKVVLFTSIPLENTIEVDHVHYHLRMFTNDKELLQKYNNSPKNIDTSYTILNYPFEIEMIDLLEFDRNSQIRVVDTLNISNKNVDLIDKNIIIKRLQKNGYNNITVNGRVIVNG